MKVGIIGCGNIGQELAKFLDSSNFFILDMVNDINKEKAKTLSDSLKRRPKVASFDDVVSKSDLIIEAAGREAAKKILERNLFGKKVMIMSTGVFSDTPLKRDAEIYLPSGAIAGIDGLKAASGMIDELEITTTKPAKGLEGSPFVVKNKVKLDTKRIIFEGSLKDAIEGFPSNINVAATVKVAAGKEPRIRIVCDPEAKTNTHRIIAKGRFGKIETITENMPSSNPKTSYLAILSAIQCLKNIQEKNKVGC